MRCLRSKWDVFRGYGATISCELEELSSDRDLHRQTLAQLTTSLEGRKLEVTSFSGSDDRRWVPVLRGSAHPRLVRQYDRDNPGWGISVTGSIPQQQQTMHCNVSSHIPVVPPLFPLRTIEDRAFQLQVKNMQWGGSCPLIMNNASNILC